MVSLCSRLRVRVHEVGLKSDLPVRLLTNSLSIDRQFHLFHPVLRNFRQSCRRFSRLRVVYAAWISPKRFRCRGHTACPLWWPEGHGACHVPLRTLESKQLKLSVTAANKPLRGFEAK